MTPDNPTPPTEAELHAWVDGQLRPDRVAAVVHWLQQSPTDAERVRAWKSQRQALQALGNGVLDEDIPLHLVHIVRPQRSFSWQQGLAACVLLSVGFAGGWSLHPPAKPSLMASAAAPPFVREAQAAHVVYTPEKRHPVEVGAQEQAHLVQWLSRRLGTPLKAPILDTEGFTLVGGRLLAGDDAQPRALFMYENSAGQRVTLHISTMPASAPPPESQGAAVAPANAEFQFNRVNDTETFYWVEDHLGYALSGNLPRAIMAQLAERVYPQLLP
jgi:anti-sigma factor RsiW